MILIQISIGRTTMVEIKNLQAPASYASIMLVEHLTEMECRLYTEINAQHTIYPIQKSAGESIGPNPKKIQTIICQR